MLLPSSSFQRIPVLLEVSNDFRSGSPVSAPHCLTMCFFDHKPTPIGTIVNCSILVLMPSSTSVVFLGRLNANNFTESILGDERSFLKFKATLNQQPHRRSGHPWAPFCDGVSSHFRCLLVIVHSRRKMICCTNRLDV